MAGRGLTGSRQKEALLPEIALVGVTGERGAPARLGASVEPDGVHFAVFSAHAERIELCLFDPAGVQERRRLPLPGRTEGDVHFGFAMAAGPLFALLLAASVAILWRGHDQPGGGFIGGLVASLAFAVLSLARGPMAAARTLRVAPTVLVGAGLLLAVASGLPGMIGGGAYLTHLWWEPGGWLPKLGTTLVFDIGVYLVVLGAVLTYLFGLQKEAVR